MGWASGSRVFRSVIESVTAHVPDVSARKEIYRPIIDAFRDMDWDTLDECLGIDPAYDEIYNDIYGDDEIW